MNYARVENGSVVEYPYTAAMLKQANPNTSFPKNPLENANVREGGGIVEVAPVTAPESDTHNVVEVTPVNSGGTWTQTWEQTPKSANELNRVAVAKREGEYGLPAQQIEFITENGLEAWQTKVAEIKGKYPKV